VDTRTATVLVPSGQLSLAIGKDGQNARLAARLTGWRIDIKGVDEGSSNDIKGVDEGPTEAPMEAEAGAPVAVESAPTGE